ncbi:MAG TPA: hypothetical protein VHD36_21780 [Pirellulales bacterium]|nr:hypothetical protein [Pirellulales bacterium]
MNGKKWILAAALTLLLAGGAGAYYAFRTDPKVALVMDLGQQLRNEDLSREDRGKLFGQMREAMDQLSDEQRRQVRQQFDRGNDGWRKREQEKMNEFFAMSKKDQTKALDKDIDEMLKRRKEWEKKRKERDAERAKQQASGTAGNNNGNNGGQGGGRGGNGGGGDRGQQRRSALDNSSAARQTQRAEYGRMMANRMVQRGIPMTGGGGGPGRRGF